MHAISLCRHATSMRSRYLHSPSMAKKDISIYNSMSQRKEKFKPKHPNGNIVTFYVCGPTVYAPTHLGHARTYIQFDMIRRVLRDYCGYNVYFAMNVTDIDDKIVKRAREENVSCSALSKKWELSFFNDMSRIGVEYPTITPRATEYIPEILDYVSKLSEHCGYKGIEESDRNSIYFDIKKLKELPMPLRYGLLRNIESENESSSSSLSVSDHSSNEAKGKRNRQDFALWKEIIPDSKDAINDSVWKAPWGGFGRPGWHSECAAMIQATLGKIHPHIDIHGGGVDLCFPHHENERIQAEVFNKYCCPSHGYMNQGDNSVPWVSWFIHTGRLDIQGRKMSKSLKNYLTIEDVLQEDPTLTANRDEKIKLTRRQFRLLFLNMNYRDVSEFTGGKVDRVKVMDKNFQKFFDSIEQIKANKSSLVNAMQSSTKMESEDIDFTHTLSSTISKAHDAIQDDFDIPEMLSQLISLTKSTQVYINKVSSSNRSCSLALIESSSNQVQSLLSLVGIHYQNVPTSSFQTLPSALTSNQFYSTSSQSDSKHQTSRNILDQSRSVNIMKDGGERILIKDMTKEKRVTKSTNGNETITDIVIMPDASSAPSDAIKTRINKDAIISDRNNSAVVVNNNNNEKRNETEEIMKLIIEFRKEVREKAKMKDIKGVFDACDRVRKEMVDKYNVKIKD